jgi:hypothetical protein
MCFVVGMWIHKKGQSGCRYDEIRVKFALCFNISSPTEANLCKLEKEMFLTSSLLDAK